MLCKTSGALNRKEVICWSKVGQIQNRKNELPRTKNKKTPYFAVLLANYGVLLTISKT